VGHNKFVASEPVITYPYDYWSGSDFYLI